VGRYLSRVVYFLFFFGFVTQSLSGQSPIIKVGSDNAYFPFEYLNDDRDPDGFDIDLLHSLVKESGLEVKITTGDWFIIKDKMKNGEFDMLAGMYYNPDRAEYYDFTMPYIIITHSVFVKNGSKIESLNDIKEDKSIRVVVENSSILHKYLTTNGVLPERILAVENQLDALFLVEDSYTTCALLPDLQAKYVAKKNGLDDIETVGLPILPREYSFAVSKGDTALLNTLNIGLTKMHQSGKYEEIFEKWFGKYNPTYSALEEKSSIFWLISIFLTVILVFVYLFMQFRLKKLVVTNKKLNNEIKQTNQVLKDVYKNETLLKRIIEYSPFPIAMIHEEGYFVFTNSGFEDLFGKQSDKAGSVNRWLSEAIKKEQEQSFIKSQFFYNPKDLVIQGINISVYTLTTKTGEEKLMQLHFISLGNGQLLIFFYGLEVNQEKTVYPKSTEKKFKELKSSFLLNVSHEIRSPMNVIMGFSEMMKTDDLATDEIKLYAGMIHQNAQMLLLLLKNIGTLVKIDAEELHITPEFILVPGIINSVYKQFKGVDYLENNVSVSCIENSVKDLIVNTNRGILTRILLNLLSYVDKLAINDSVKIGCELKRNKEVNFFIYAHCKEDVYQSLSQKIKIAAANYTDNNLHFNSGEDLNLYVSLALIKLIGSKLEINRDEKNEKSKLSFSLPNFSDDDPVAQYKTRSLPNKKQQFNWEGKKILIADDNPDSLDYFRLIFKSTKAEIITAKDGSDAYERCRKEINIDLVLMDWLMPIMDGETSTKLIKQLKPTLPIIAVTAFALGDERTKILQSGCVAYYPKPVNKGELLSCIDVLFNK